MSRLFVTIGEQDDYNHLTESAYYVLADNILHPARLVYHGTCQ